MSPSMYPLLLLRILHSIKVLCGSDDDEYDDDDDDIDHDDDDNDDGDDEFYAYVSADYQSTTRPCLFRSSQ